MLRKTKLALPRYIRSAPKADLTGPVCATCNRVVDYEALVEGYPGVEDSQERVVIPAGGETCKVLVRHHGAEETCVFDMGSRLWGPSDLRKWMQRKRWFDPLADGGHCE